MDATVDYVPATYEDKIFMVFSQLCDKQGGASPAEVTAEMSNRGWLSELDTVIDIVDLMGAMRARGRL